MSVYWVEPDLGAHQTIQLGTGRHLSPSDGVCVMELASMLAGEKFSDHPAAVCPVIAAFLRAYNDSIDDRRRQDLYRYASAVVGSRATRAVEQARLEWLAAWLTEQRDRRRARWPSPLRTLTGGRPHIDPDPARAARKLAAREQTHAAALALLDELLVIGASPTVAPLATPLDATPPAHARAE
jgi:hypothetical protein